MRQQAPDLAERLARRTDAWCRVPSPTGQEAALADAIASEARDAGLRVVRHRDCLILHPQGADDVADVLLVGHLDTVPCAADQPEGIIGERVFGCGASDMKGALAVIFDRLCRPSRLSLAALLYDREEGPYADNGLAMLRATGLLPAARAALVMEPTANAIEAGCLGNLHATLTLQGRRAHSARPWQGINALQAAWPLLRALDGLAPEERQVGGLVYRRVMSATTAATHNGRNVVPDRFTLNLNLRFTPDETCEDAEAWLNQWLADCGLPHPWSLEITDRAPAGEVCTDAPHLGPWLRRHELEVRPKQAWTDVAQLTAAGIPAINFGPGDPAEAHQARESVAIEALVRSWLLLDDLAGTP
jgi:succinyl-diaminopimelate desuccinylase